MAMGYAPAADGVSDERKKERPNGKNTELTPAQSIALAGFEPLLSHHLPQSSRRLAVRNFRQLAAI